MTHDPSAIYTREWYDDVRRGLGGEYVLLADIIDATFAPYDTVIDVGCGAGLVLDRLLALGRRVMGVDGSQHAIAAASPEVRSYLIEADLRIGAPPAGQFDLVICTEVAEHVDAVHASRLVATLVQLARGPIFFTAAYPGQGGTDHVNEQPASYWIERFARHGRFPDFYTTAEVRQRLRVLSGMHWFQKTAMVIR